MYQFQLEGQVRSISMHMSMIMYSKCPRECTVNIRQKVRATTSMAMHRTYDQNGRRIHTAYVSKLQHKECIQSFKYIIMISRMLSIRAYLTYVQKAKAIYKTPLFLRFTCYFLAYEKNIETPPQQKSSPKFDQAHFSL